MQKHDQFRKTVINDVRLGFGDGPLKTISIAHSNLKSLTENGDDILLASKEVSSHCLVP